MRRLRLRVALCVCATVAALAACKAQDNAGRTAATANGKANVTVKTNSSPQAQTASATEEDIRRISIADARREVEAGRAVFVDVRSNAEYERKHIAGALSVPKAQTAEKAGSLPRNKLIINYCA